MCSNVRHRENCLPIVSQSVLICKRANRFSSLLFFLVLFICRRNWPICPELCLMSHILEFANSILVVLFKSYYISKKKKERKKSYYVSIWMWTDKSRGLINSDSFSFLARILHRWCWMLASSSLQEAHKAWLSLNMFRGCQPDP